MTLQIRDERAQELAQMLAEKRNMTVADAVIYALEEELRRMNIRTPLSVRVSRLADELKAQAGPNGRPVSKNEVDEMWGGP